MFMWMDLELAMLGLLGAVSEKVGGILGVFIWTQLVEILSAPISVGVLIVILGVGIVVMLQASFSQIVGFLVHYLVLQSRWVQ